MILSTKFNYQDFVGLTITLVDNLVDHRGGDNNQWKSKVSCNVVVLYEKYKELINYTIKSIEADKTANITDDSAVNALMNAIDTLNNAIEAYCDSLSDKNLARDVAATWGSLVSEYSKELKKIDGNELLADYGASNLMKLPLKYMPKKV